MRNKEKQVAQKIIDHLDSSTLDFEEVGKIIANTQPTFVANRLNIILESARDEKESLNERFTNYLR